MYFVRMLTRTREVFGQRLIGRAALLWGQLIDEIDTREKQKRPNVKMSECAPTFRVLVLLAEKPQLTPRP